MVAKLKKVPTSPPWWVRAPLYSALWLKPEFEEYRLSLQLRYGRLVRKGNKRAISRFCFRESFYWTLATGQRFKYAVFLALSRAI